MFRTSHLDGAPMCPLYTVPHSHGVRYIPPISYTQGHLSLSTRCTLCLVKMFIVILFELVQKAADPITGVLRTSYSSHSRHLSHHEFCRLVYVALQPFCCISSLILKLSHIITQVDYTAFSCHGIFKAYGRRGIKELKKQ